MKGDYSVQIPDGTLFVVRKEGKITVHEWDGYAGKNGKWYVYHTFTDSDLQAMSDLKLDCNSNVDVKTYLNNVTPNRTVAPAATNLNEG